MELSLSEYEEVARRARQDASIALVNKLETWERGTPEEIHHANEAHYRALDVAAAAMDEWREANRTLRLEAQRRRDRHKARLRRRRDLRRRAIEAIGGAIRLLGEINL